MRIFRMPLRFLSFGSLSGFVVVRIFNIHSSSAVQQYLAPMIALAQHVHLWTIDKDLGTIAFSK